MDKIKFEEFLEKHYKIREVFLLTLAKTLKDSALKHIHRGFIMRFCMMESAIKSLYDEVGLSEEVLSQSQSINLSLLLNAYYLNLTGSLDNLAWALTHHFKLITPKIDESNRFQQRFVNLTGKDFNKELEKKGLQKLANQLLQMNSWCISVKKFRNPAAHNIPLLVPYTIFSENDAKKYKELDEKAAELIKSGKSRKGMELLIESHNLGKHYPVFITEYPKMQIYLLPKQINEDHENWLKLVEAIFEFGFNVKLN